MKKKLRPTFTNTEIALFNSPVKNLNACPDSDSTNSPLFTQLQDSLDLAKLTLARSALSRHVFCFDVSQT